MAEVERKLQVGEQVRANRSWSGSGYEITAGKIYTVVGYSSFYLNINNCFKTDPNRTGTFEVGWFDSVTGSVQVSGHTLSEAQLREGLKVASSVVSIPSRADSLNPFSEYLDVRMGGNLSNKSFFLTGRYSWELKKDNEGATVLVPTRKY